MKPIKTYILLSLLFLNFVKLFSQDLPKIIPPSPNASSFHVYGNNAVSHYSGTVNVSIPIYEINEGGINIPLYLNYNAGNGVKIEDRASWVGLGWTLNTGGAVSRVKRGVADEARYGFMNLSALPQEEIGSNDELLNWREIRDIGLGIKDGEPDKFMYSSPSASGSFFINFDETIHLKPFNDIAISFEEGGTIEQVSSFYCNPSGNLKRFIIKDNKGTQYTFEDKEYSNSKIVGKSFYNNLSYPTSWYLNNIKNPSASHEVNYEYEPYLYKMTRVSGVFNGSHESDGFTEDHYVGKRLSRINFPSGNIEFNKTSLSRKDIEDEYALESIVIKDNNGSQIKKITFNYGYFTSNSILEYDNPSLIVSEQNRLILKSIKELDSNNAEVKAHHFTYNTDHYLPSNYSKAKDHWGYYNGQNSNTKFQPKHFFTWFNGVDGEWVTDVYGSADRNSNNEYAKAGILKEITYPTGGKTTFVYEGNIVKDDRLQANLVSKNFSLQDIYIPNNSTTFEDFSINLYSEMAPFTELNIRAFNYNPNACSPIVYIKNLTTNEIHTVSFVNTNNNSTQLNISSSTKTLILPAENYRAYFLMDSNTLNCNNTNPAIVSISWDEEDGSTSKPVGGVRIKEIVNNDNNGNIYSRKFDYANDDGDSSGRVNFIPEYSYQNYIFYPNTSVLMPLSYAFRSGASINPLNGDGGNTVGYSKVTEIHQESQTTFGTEYYFTTSEQFPDTKNGFIGDQLRNVFEFQGRLIRTHPPVPENTMPYMRGKLIEKKDYLIENGIIKTLREEKHNYKNLFFLYDTPGMEHLESSSKIIEGISVYWGQNQTLGNLKKYKIHSGYSFLESTDIKSHYNTTSIGKFTIHYYDENENGILKRYLPIKTETHNSKGETIKVSTSFVEDIINPTSAEQKLIDQHRLATPIKTETIVTDEGVELSKQTQKTIYHNWGNDLILPNKIQTLKGEETPTNQPEPRLTYHNYDNKGNPLEVSKADGTKIYYVWGYNKTQPIAKIEGYTDVQLANVKNLIDTAILKSDSDNDREVDTFDANGTIIPQGNEGKLREALRNLRNHFATTTTQVTTYTYDPLIGVTSITDSRGETIYYHYDSFNRLQYIKDQDNNILSENAYNYKPKTN